MENVTSEPSPSLIKENRSLYYSLLTFDLPDLIEKMKHEDAWEKGDLDAMILLKTPEKQIVLAALHEGSEINSFQSNDSITFQIIEGQLMFRTKKESVTLEKGQLMTLHERTDYTLTTNEETVLLLTITNFNLQNEEN